MSITLSFQHDSRAPSRVTSIGFTPMEGMLFHVSIRQPSPLTSIGFTHMEGMPFQ